VILRDDNRSIEQTWNMKKWYSFYTSYEDFGDAVNALSGQMNISSLKLQQVAAEIQETASEEKLQQVVAEIPFPAIFGFIPWGHHIEIITKCKDLHEALFYVKRTIEERVKQHYEDLQKYVKSLSKAELQERLYNALIELEERRKSVGMILVRALRRMDASIDAITKFSLNQFSGRYMLHLLARFTSYVNVRMGNPSQFDVYVDRKRKGNTYDIEHILPDDYDSYSDEFADAEDFQTSRQMIGNLIILTRDKNRSYQAMKYQEKVGKYVGDNVLAQALNSTAYASNPQFLAVAKEYGFAPIPKFTKDSIADRAKIYLQMAADIWDPDAIKDIASGWEEETEKEFFKSEKAREFTVEYYEKSWPDALKYGFLSANIGGTGKFLKNIQVGDIVYCHIAGAGFVGIGECTAAAVPMKQFMVTADGTETPITDVTWIESAYRAKLDVDKEIFIRVDWKSYVQDQKDGYWEKGMTSVPMVAYQLSDQSTHKKVREHFGCNSI